MVGVAWEGEEGFAKIRVLTSSGLKEVVRCAAISRGSVVVVDFVGEGGNLFGTFLAGALLTMVTFGIYGSWFTVSMKKFWNQNTRIAIYNRTYALDFTGQGADLFVINLVTSLLTMVTLGIYVFWGQVKKMKWDYQNTLVRALN